MCSNMQEVAAAQRKLAAGEDFGKVAREVSRNASTARNGGELPPFTKDDKRFPPNFREVAFALKEGEISDPVVAEGSYHLIQVEKKDSAQGREI